LATQLATALDSRILIEQAKGMLAERAGLSIADAFGQLRRYARSHNQKLTSVCQGVIEGRLSSSDLSL
jgi:AmiR/NasT family two-component response regulator